MIQSVRAIYEKGVLRPLESLRLEENAEVRVTVEIETPSVPESVVYDDPFEGIAVDTGIPDLAEHFDDYRFGRRTP